jgi:hypothetical protein
LSQLQTIAAPMPAPRPTSDARMKSVMKLAAKRYHQRPYDPHAGATIRIPYATRATMPPAPIAMFVVVS